jgi:3-oxoacyl-[acyl-carrier protein] reductase
MDLALGGKVALVTGAGAGIGRAIALRLAAEGVAVAVLDRDREHAEAVVEEIGRLGGRATAVAADVARFAEAQTAVGEVVSRLGGLHILVCNAGITRDGMVWSMSEEQWDQVLAVNLKGYFNYCRASAPRMRDQKYGKIVNIASINGLRGKFGQANYAAAKGGVIALSKTLARELGKFGVTVNVVAPGMVLTEMMRSLPPEVLKKALDETVCGRFAVPEDVADLCAFLASDRSRHITGEVIKIDGGQYI